MSPAAYLDRHADDLTGLLRRLVILPTVNPPGEDYDAITALLTRDERGDSFALPLQRLEAEEIHPRGCTWLV